MPHLRRLARRAALAAALALPLAAAGQATAVAISPPPGARFLPGQRFDLRVEGRGTAPFRASLAVNGEPLRFTSGEAPGATDGISPFDGAARTGVGGFDVRGHSLPRPGRYTLAATFTDASGIPVHVTSTITVERIGGESGGIKNVILFLGDGMGIAHRTAARIVSKGVTAGTPDGRLAMEGLPGVGLVSTASLSSLVTDSAPGMSCYTTGNHARNGQEGVFPGTVTNPFTAPRVEYLGAYLHRTRGTALGIVTTADVEDATPAAMAVHTAARAAGTGICDQLLDEADAAGTRRFGSGLRVLLGGGRRWFVPATDPRSSRAAARDYGPLPADLVRGWGLPPEAAGVVDPDRDLLGDFRKAGFAYADSKASLDAALAARPARLLGLFAWGDLDPALDRIGRRRARAASPGAPDAAARERLAPDQPMLDELTAAALAVLQGSQEGFVLLVEGALIDKQSHRMDAERAIGETIELDRAVAVGLDFARRDGQTLVLVTADHECSGLALLAGPDGAGFPRYRTLADGFPETFDVEGKLLFGFGADGGRLTPPRPGLAVHTATDVPLTAYARERAAWLPFVGAYQDTDVFFKIMQVLAR